MSLDREGRPLVFQYTRIETVRSMLTLADGHVPRELWATSTPYMNDLQEFEHGKRLFLNALDGYDPQTPPLGFDAVSTMREVAEAVDGRNVYCSCLSAKEDDLNQWRGYGDGGRGACLGFRYDDLMEAFRDTAGWIVYQAEEQSRFVQDVVEAYIAAAEPDTNSIGTISPEARFRSRLKRFLPTVFPFFKDPAFQEEREFRIVYSPERNSGLEVQFRSDGSRLIPYVRLTIADSEGKAQPMPVSSIRFGPGSSSENNKAALRRLLDLKDLNEIEVQLSGIPFLPTG